MAENKEERQKAKSKGFAEIGVPIGAVLTFRKDPGITATVVDDKNKVEYQGKVYRISGLAKELMKTAISGYHAFKYNGVLLAKLGDSKIEQPVASPAETPAETADVASSAPEVIPTPQTIPLPESTPTASDDPLMASSSMDNLAENDPAE